MLWFVLGDGGLTVPVLQPFGFSLRMMFLKCILSWTLFSELNETVLHITIIILIGKLLYISLVVWQGYQHYFLWPNRLSSMWTVFHHNISAKKVQQSLAKMSLFTPHHQTKESLTARAVPITSG